MLDFPAWLGWLILAIALVSTDILLLGFQLLLVFCGMAALISGLVSVWGAHFEGQLWTFLGALVVVVPLWIFFFHSNLGKKRKGPRAHGWEEGEVIDVVKQGDRLVGKWKSDFFPIRLADGTQPREGERMVVERMEGITLVVHRLNNKK
jgi:membrane protein implicated in regulation of membrane protease activity